SLLYEVCMSNIFCGKRRFSVLLALVLLCFFAASSGLRAQYYLTSGTVSVSPQPLAALFDGEALHVLCNEVDVNFNGVQDAGDTPASWVRIPFRNFALDQQSAQTLRFAWGESFGFPARPAFDSAGKTLVLAQRGRIRSFDTRSQTLRRDTLLLVDSLARSTFGTTGSVSAMSIDAPSGRLFVSLRGRSTSAVVEIDIATSRVVTRFPAGIFVQQTLPYTTSTGRRGLAILNEGSFGSNTSTLMLARSPQDITTIALGNTGNHLLRNGNEIIATMNGSHELQIVNVNEERIVRRISTGTRGFDGPRESAVVGFNQVAVTSYDGFVRIFSLFDGSTRGTVSTNSKSEGLVVLPFQTILVADAFRAGSFTSASTLSILRVVINSTRENNPVFSRSVIAPHPVSGTARISLNAVSGLHLGSVSLQLMNMLGNVVTELPWERHENSIEARIDADALALPNGSYMVRIGTAQGVTGLPLQIIR
ncbi:MAG: hypothetical protein ACOVSW_18210, partial [Candidatus Kapaibacteriota bacterium]